MKKMWMILLLAGCGSEVESSDPPIEISNNASNVIANNVNNENNDLPTDCEQHTFSPMFVSEGGRLKVDKVDRWTLNFPESFRVIEEDSRFLVKPPYGETGEFEVEASNECGVQEQISLTVKPISWEPVSQWVKNEPGRPIAREHAAMWVLDNVLYLAHGWAYEPRQFTPVFDAWALDLETGVWSETTQSGDVPVTTGGRVAVADGAVYLSGGSDDSTGTIPDSFYRATIDGTEISWENMTDSATGGGGARQLGAFVFDQQGDRFIGVHGIGPQDIYSRTQVTDAVSPDWTVVATMNDPSPRYGTFFGMDQEYRRLIVFSGAQGRTAAEGVNPAEDTWALQVGDGVMEWTQIAEDSTPPGRRNGCFALDTENLRFFVHGGTPDARTSAQGLWVLDLEPGHERWEELEVDDGPQPRSSCSSFYDPATKKFYMGLGNGNAIWKDIWGLDLSAR